MKAAKGSRGLSSAELRALRDQRLATGPASEAGRREASFLRNISGAGDDLEWILLNQAWTQLDFERVGDWWEQRVLPVLDKLDLRPSASLAERVIAAIQADEQVLPKTQRRTQREIASIAKTSQARVSRLLADSRESGSDLEETPSGPAAEPDPGQLADAVSQAIADAAERAAAADEDEPEPGTLPAEAWRCEKCDGQLAVPFARTGQRRCINCDVDRVHVAAAPGGPCLVCSETATGEDAQSGAPVDAGSVPAAGSGAVFPGAGPGHPHTAAVGDAHPPTADGVEAGRELAYDTPAPDGVPVPGTPSGVTPRETIGCPQCTYAVAVSTADPDASLDEMYGHLRRTHDLDDGQALAALGEIEERIEEEAAGLPVDPPAADREPHSPRQPGQDSPTGQEAVQPLGGRSETDSPVGPDQQQPRSDHADGPAAVATTVLPGTDHHPLAGGRAGGVAPEAPHASGPEGVEPWDGDQDSSSHGDPDHWESPAEAVVRLFKSFTEAIERIDHEAIGAELTAIDLFALRQCRDRLAEHVFLLEKYSSP